MAQSTDQLKEELFFGLLNVYEEAKKQVGYDARIFCSMLSKLREIKTVENLVGRHEPSEGFVNLTNLGRTDLTIEAFLIKNPQYNRLFNRSVIDMAKKRLKDPRNNVRR